MRRFRGSVRTLLLALLLFSGGAQAAEFLPGPCPFELPRAEVEGETIVCGRLLVSMQRTASGVAIPESGTVELPLAILRSRAEQPGTPIVYLEGGPGAPAVAYVPTWWAGSRLREHADLIVFDQRGTGLSTPSLDCYEWYLAGVSDPDAACRSRLARAGIDLTAFGSDDSADDVADLLTALGIEQANLFGVSYGTRLALTILRRHPERVRAAVLDGVYPPEAEHLERQGPLGYGALTAVFAACEADPACATAYPQLERALTSAVRRLDLQPMDGAGGPEVDGREAYRTLVDLLYDGEAAAYVPALVYAAFRRDAATWHRTLDRAQGPWMSDATYRGEIELLMRLLAGIDDPDAFDAYLDGLDADAYELLRARAEGLFDDDAEAMYLSVECAEEVAFADVSDAARLIAALPNELAFLRSDVVWMIETCRFWEIAEGPDGTRDPVVADVPVLLLSGAFDPITPPALAEETARYLPAAFTFTFANRGHAVVGTDPCADEVALAFLEAPGVRPAPACLDAPSAPRFALP